MIILGIDPGTATTGYGIIQSVGKTNEFKILDFGVISTNKNDSDSERLFVLANDLEKIIKKFKPESVGVEKLFFTTNQKTAMTVAQARGVVLFTCQKNKLKTFEFTPLQIKSFICGYGKAPKTQVQFIIQKTFSLKNIPRPDDAADALAIALCAGFHTQKQKSF